VLHIQELQERATVLEQERASLALLLEDLSSSLGEGLLVVAADLELRLINPVALRFFGAERMPAGSHLLELVREPDMVELVSHAAGGARPRAVITENPRGLWEVRAFPIRGGGAVVLMSDVSLVRRSAEFRRRFVQDLSHELRSPLTVLRTTVEALEDEVDPRVGEVVVRQVERINRLTNELYELASLEAGNVELKLEPVPVRGLVTEVLADLAPEAERLGVSLVGDLPPALEAWCDRRGLYRVLTNLVDNAIKYNRPGGKVEVLGAQLGERVRVQVSDTGEGIPAGELKAVLQRFYRVDRARTPGRGGLGLGLAIVKHMVQHMGGTLDLDSREAVGTVVTLTFSGPTRRGRNQ
jgi:two-component system phosphate regulon sensor histidine kinase PhoR